MCDYVLIGGSSDGQRLAVEGRPNSVTVPVRVMYDVFKQEYERYDLVELRDGAGTHFAYMHGARKRVIEQLLMGYRR